MGYREFEKLQSLIKRSSKVQDMFMNAKNGVQIVYDGFQDKIYFIDEEEIEETLSYSV